MSANSLAPLQTEAYVTPVAFQGLHEKGLVVMPNQEHIARIGAIIGEELPDYALPTDVEELAIVIRGSTRADDTRKLMERDFEWRHAPPEQPLFPSDQLNVPDIAAAQAVTKADIAQAGRYILEYSGVNPGSWGPERPEWFTRQWTARRALLSIAKNVPHEVAGAFSNMPLLGSKSRKVNSILRAVKDEKLDPFYVTKRRPRLPEGDR